jgi:hypothetical protein
MAWPGAALPHHRAEGQRDRTSPASSRSPEDCVLPEQGPRVRAIQEEQVGWHRRGAAAGEDLKQSKLAGAAEADNGEQLAGQAPQAMLHTVASEGASGWCRPVEMATQ